MKFLKELVVFLVVFPLGMMVLVQFGTLPFMFLEQTWIPPGSAHHATLISIATFFPAIFGFIGTIAVWLSIRRLNAKSAGQD